MTFLEMSESNLHDFLTEASVSTDSNDSVASNSSNLTLNNQQYAPVSPPYNNILPTLPVKTN